MKKRRGFIQIAILHLLRETSMHGYQIMKELEERSEGLYNASAGTVYPALQELLDNGSVLLDDDGSDKKVYSINEIGKKRLNEFSHHEEGDFWLDWKEHLIWRNSKESVLLKHSMKQWEFELKKTIKYIRQNPEKTPQLVGLLEELTERLKKEFK